MKTKQMSRFICLYFEDGFISVLFGELRYKPSLLDIQGNIQEIYTGLS